jgi:hypothetical protein
MIESIWCMIFLKFTAFSYAIVLMYLFSVLLDCRMDWHLWTIWLMQKAQD